MEFVSYIKILSVMLHNNSRLGLLARFFRHHHHHSITARVLNFVRKTCYFMDSSASSRLLFWKMELQTFKYASLIWIDGATISNILTYLGIAVAKFSLTMLLIWRWIDSRVSTYTAAVLKSGLEIGLFLGFLLSDFQRLNQLKQEC